MDELKSLYANAIYVNGNLIINNSDSNNLNASNYFSDTKLSNYRPESFSRCNLASKIPLQNGTYMAYYKSGSTLINFGLFLKLYSSGDTCTTCKDISTNIWTLYFDGSGYPYVKRGSDVQTSGYLYFKRLDT